MKNQILRLCFGMAWCLSALVPVHAPAAGASRDGGSRSAAGHPNRRGANTPLPGRYAARRLFHRHTCHAGQCTGLALPRGRRRSQRVGCRTGHLRRGSHQHGQRRGTGARVRADVTARKPWFTVMGNHETTWSESGCTTFRCIFGHDGRVAHRAGGYLFLGYNCGPYMKMADGVVRTEDLAWLGAQAAGPVPANVS